MCMYLVLQISMCFHHAVSCSCLISVSRLAQVQAVYESLQRQAVGRIHVLQEGLKQASAFANKYNGLLDDISAKSTELEQMPAVGMDIETVEVQLQDFKVPRKERETNRQTERGRQRQRETGRDRE